MTTALDDLAAATDGLDAPFAALHLPSLRANLADLRRRAGGTRLRIASKSVRCLGVLREVLGPDLAGDEAVRGVMAFSLDEALRLVGLGCRDVLVGYPTVNRAALERLGADPVALDAVTLMVDDVAQLDLAARHGAAGARVCVDVDASLRIGPVHLGARRSPLRTPADAARVATAALGRGFRPVGVMFYEAQVAGIPDSSPAVRAVKRLSMRELRRRRGAVVEAVAGVTGGPLEIVDSGGTGSVAESAADPVVTEVVAGSGLYVPALFDHYRSFAPRPALAFALDVVRRPTAGISTLAYGGYAASGAPGRDRLPVPARPVGLRLIGSEGMGEVQTPVRAGLPVGSRTWWRPAKAGEPLERFAELHVVDRTDDGPRIVARWPTYRGEGMCLG